MINENCHLRIALYYGIPPGGAKRAALEQTRRLSQKHDISVYSIGAFDKQTLDLRQYSSFNFELKFESSNLFNPPFGRFNQGIRSLDLLRLRKISKHIANTINNGRYDVALVHPCKITNTPLILQYLSIPSIYYAHEYNRFLHDSPIVRPYINTGSFKNKLDKFDPLLKTYSHLLGWSENKNLHCASSVLVNSHYTQSKFRIIYNIDTQVNYLGVDVEEYPNLSLQKDNFVLSVGVISPLKGFDFIIRGLEHIEPNKRPALKLVGFYQKLEEKEYLARLAKKSRVELVFIDNADHQTLVKLYNRSLITIYTPINEPFGLVPLESMACGTPVIGIREGGVQETIIDGINGYLIPRKSEVLAERITYLLSEPERLNNMSKKCRNYVQQHWNWESSIANLEKHLYDVARK